MIISDNGEYVGAVSGGCIEQEIERQAQNVFRTGIPRVITYDGRLRVGCEGILFLLIEPVFLSAELLNDFESVLKLRIKFRLDTYFYQSVEEYANTGTFITLGNTTYPLNPALAGFNVSDQECFSQTFDPLFRMYIIGAEHDAVQLCQSATLLGWEVTIVAPAEESKSCDYFPGASALISPTFENIDTKLFDIQTAVVLMSHSFNRDVQYLIALRDCRPAYLGIVGSVKRRERVLSILLEYCPDISVDFLDQIHGPAGLSIGAENASEIAVSILAEILTVIRNQEPVSLRSKTGSIHS
jgi:xanthine/CO dehydrogenase XdhC/CoxF family maturation factor